jgi:hypothetical protein
VQNDQVERKYHKSIPAMKDKQCLEENLSFPTYFLTIISVPVPLMGFKPSLYLQIIRHMFYHWATRVKHRHLDIEGQLMSEVVHDVPDRRRV